MEDKSVVKYSHVDMDDMPESVQKIAKTGAEIEFCPEPFEERDNCPCGECYTIYMAGWYKILPHNSRLILCDVNGNPASGKNGNKFGIIGSKEGVYNA